MNPGKLHPTRDLIWSQSIFRNTDFPAGLANLGYDPSGFDIERDLRQKLWDYCHDRFWYGDWTETNDPWEWTPKCVSFRRLAVLESDFDDFDLLPLAPKELDNRYAQFAEERGTRCAEVDALPATELRRRVKEAIEEHIPKNEWDRLIRVEDAERETFQKTLGRLKA
jgi:hypothetical protein